MFSAYFSGSLVQLYGTRTVFGLTAVFPLIISLSAMLIQEERVSLGPYLPVSARGDGSSSPAAPNPMAGLVPRLKAQVLSLRGAIMQRSILLPAVFVFLWQVRTPPLVRAYNA